MIEIERENSIGKITKYFRRIEVAVLELTDTLKVGDTIQIVGGMNTNFTQTVESMEIEHEKIAEARPGDDVALKVKQIARKGCRVFKI